MLILELFLHFEILETQTVFIVPRLPRTIIKRLVCLFVKVGSRIRFGTTEYAASPRRLIVGNVFFFCLLFGFCVLRSHIVVNLVIILNVVFIGLNCAHLARIYEHLANHFNFLSLFLFLSFFALSSQTQFDSLFGLLSIFHQFFLLLFLFRLQLLLLRSSL